MDQEKLKESVLIDLRSVILSSKGGVPLNRLQSDYRQLIGTSIPLSQLGYSSLESFLQNNSQVANLRRNPDGQLFVEAVANSSTAHLQKLISKQKGAGVSKYSAKYGKKAAVTQRAVPSTSSKDREALLEKDKIIEDLNSRLEREKLINKDLYSQITRLNSAVQSYHANLRAEQETNKLLKNQIEIVRASNQTQNSNGIASPSELVSKLHESNLQRTSDPCSSMGRDICTHCELNNKNEQQCTEMEELKTQMQKQNIRMQKIEQKFNQQSQKLESYAQKIPPSIDVHGLAQMLLKSLNGGTPSTVAKSAVKNGSEKGAARSEQVRITASPSSRNLSSPAVPQISEPPKATTKRKKKKKP